MDQGVLTQPEPAAHFPFPTSTADLTRQGLVEYPAGWDVTVLLRDVGDTRPLEILGARVLELASVLKEWEQWPHPQTIAVVKTRALPLGIDVQVVETRKMKIKPDVFGVLLQYPATTGKVEDLSALAAKAKAAYKTYLELAPTASTAPAVRQKMEKL